MNFSSNYYSHLRLTPSRSGNSLFFSPQTLSRLHEFRVYKRRHLKLSISKLVICNQLNFSSDNGFLQNLSSLEFLAPVLGLTSGVAVYLSSRLNLAAGGKNNVCDIGEWILFSSPTPFNRFVILRCPSISFEGSELMEGVNERLVKEDRHFVRLNTGRMVQTVRNGSKKGTELEYQRFCISTEDGGVISVDWPANLNLNEEHGLDTTVLVVPGTAEGSMDEKVRAFVREAVYCGFFPVVMNPRGCASSPLITPRLFTAADSDDISTAIEFIHNTRPGNTLMGVGWGYGANMLTKYLAEVGEETPLTAATCIDNPFDLEEATRSTPYHIALNQKLTGGLIDILRSNKELFQGRSKGFDVEKALSAKTVRDFEKAISMVSYGFDSVEDFYSKCSTRSLVGDVKIPVLFIQNDDGSVPLFSIPRSLIAENPFTSLLLCSCSPSRATISWCHRLTIEWLAAVELGLLKGRHPLLKDVDVTINPSKGLAFAEGRPTGKGGKVKKLLDPSRSTAINGYSIKTREILEDSDTAASISFQFRQDSAKDLELENKDLQGTHGMLSQAKSVEREVVKEEVNLENGGIGEVLQTAQVVMNMLDATMPGTLKEEEKQKVLAAVSQGETVMKALQDAVPEDVREKLTAAVSVFMHTQGMNLKQGIERIPKMPSKFKSKIQENINDAQSADEIKRTGDLADGSDNNQVDLDKTTGGQCSESQLSENLHKSGDVEQFQTMSSQQGDTSSVKKDVNESGKIHEIDELAKEKASPLADSSETVMESGAKPNLTIQAEKAVSSDETPGGEGKTDRDGGVTRTEMKDESSLQKKDEKVVDSSTDQNKVAPATKEEVAVPSSGNSENQPVEREGNENQKKESKDRLPAVDHNKSNIPDSSTLTFNVSQALDALTGIDDSTQIAVNSVFGVIENMISQLEENDVNESLDTHEARTESIDTIPEKKNSLEKKGDSENDHHLRETESNKNKQNTMSDGLHNPLIKNKHDSGIHTPHKSTAKSLEEESPKNLVSSEGSDNDDSWGNSIGNSLGMARNSDHIVGSKLVPDYSERPGSSIPLYKNANQYEDLLLGKYLRGYLLSKSTTEPLDLDTTTALLLDYFPEEGQWKLLEQPGVNGDSVNDVTTHSTEPEVYTAAKANKIENYIEPSYVILDAERHQEPVGDFETMDNMKLSAANDDEELGELLQLIKDTILDSLRLEVNRRLSASDMKAMKSELSAEIEKVATAAYLSIGDDEELTNFECREYIIDNASEKVCTIDGENIAKAISTAVQRTSYIRRVLPLGVIVGSSLAALREHFHLSTLLVDDENEAKAADKTKMSRKKSHEKAVYKGEQNGSFPSPISKEVAETGLKSLHKDSVMVGAVTAALGASALLASKQDPLQGKGPIESSSKTFKERGNQHKELEKLEEAVGDKNQMNMVTSLAEKAMSVAAPVVPTKEDGELDQERLVAMLTDLGQRGGMLRLVGKIALLWGGIRGAMSLTDRLITFLHMAERPLYQRILGFVGMGLVLWSPVVLPLLPTLVQSWTTKNPSKIAELVCIIGFYVAVILLVMLWGKRIREYEYPLEQYGLDLTSSSKFQGLLMGMIGGVTLVMLIQSVNALLGCVSFTWPSHFLPSSLDIMSRLKAYGKLLVLTSRGIATATSIALVEELFFRSWLPDEIATDLGYYWGIILSGLAFSLFQRSLMAIPALWLLSLALAGIRQKYNGSLSIPIGLRAGIMASSFVLQTGGFLIYEANLPLWVTATYPFQPFSGLVGLTFSLLLAIIFYPRQPLPQKNPKTSTQE